MLHFQPKRAGAARYVKTFLCAATFVVLCCGGGIRAQTAAIPQTSLTVNSTVKKSIISFPNSKYSFHGKETPQDGPLCSCQIFASLKLIPFCGDTTPPPLIAGQPPCCCYELDVWSTCPTLCSFTVQFDDNTFDPTCGICSLPPHWIHFRGEDGKEHFEYHGPEGGEVLSGGSKLPFKMCGRNSSRTIGFTVCGFYCEPNPAGGGIEPSTTEDCCPHFTAPANCATSGVVDNGTIVADMFTVSEAFPNPSNKTVKFDLTPQKNGVMAIELSSILGTEITRIAHSVVAENKEPIVLNVDNLPTGVYICAFEMNGYKVSKRFQVTR